MPPTHPHLHHQQPLDLLANAMSEREQQSGGGGLAARDDTRIASRYMCCLSSKRHSRSIVCVIFAVSLLLNATIIGVVCWRLKTGCPTLCPGDHV